MSYNAGDKVRIIRNGRSTVTNAVIVSRRFGRGRQPDTLFYRDNCAACSQSSFTRHAVGDQGTYIAN